MGKNLPQAGGFFLLFFYFFLDDGEYFLNQQKYRYTSDEEAKHPHKQGSVTVNQVKETGEYGEAEE